jgi:uncharacterized protein YjiS (DUF1127 family)
MHFESQWPGDAVAAPFWPTEDREDGFFEGPGGKSWSRVDYRGGRADGDPTAAVQRRIRRTEPVGSLSRPNRRGRWVAVVMDHLIEGFALSATTLHPEVFLASSEQARGEGESRKRRSEPRAQCGRSTVCGAGTCSAVAGPETAQSDIAGRGIWMTPITSFFAEIWSKMLREREIRHISAAWDRIDDRTLRDIGISRYEIDYAKDPRN